MKPIEQFRCVPLEERVGISVAPARQYDIGVFPRRYENWDQLGRILQVSVDRNDGVAFGRV